MAQLEGCKQKRGVNNAHTAHSNRVLPRSPGMGKKPVIPKQARMLALHVARLVRLPFRHNALPLEPTATHKMNGLAVLLSLLLNTVLARTPPRQMPTPPC